MAGSTTCLGSGYCRGTKSNYLPFVKMLSHVLHDGCLVTSLHRVSQVAILQDDNITETQGATENERI